MLTLQVKVKIVNLVDKGNSYESVAARFNKGKSTVSDVWKARERLKHFRFVSIGSTRVNQVKFYFYKDYNTLPIINILSI